MTRYRDLFVFGLLVAASWLVVLLLILCIAAIVHLVGWLGFGLGIGAFVALAVVIGSILVENAGDEEPAVSAIRFPVIPPRAPEPSNIHVLPGIHDWSMRGEL